MTPERRFLHRLALALGRTVAELEATIGANELDDWIEYYNAEPWGAYRDNLHAGIIASVVANAFRNRKSKALKPSDFVLRTRDEKRKADTAKSLSYLRAVGVKRGDRPG